jgi:hypothetical protein
VFLVKSFRKFAGLLALSVFRFQVSLAVERIASCASRSLAGKGTTGKVGRPGRMKQPVR